MEKDNKAPDRKAETLASARTAPKQFTQPNKFIQSGEIRVLLPDDFLVMPDGECVSVMTAGSKKKQLPTPIAAARFNSRDLDDPEVLVKRLQVPPERLEELIEQMRNAKKHYSFDYHLSEEDVRRTVTNLPTMVSELTRAAREHINRYKIQPSDDKMELRRSKLQQRLETPSVIHTPDIIAILKSTFSSFLILDGKELEEFKNKKLDDYSKIVPVGTIQVDEIIGEDVHVDDEWAMNFGLAQLAFDRLYDVLSPQFSSNFFPNGAVMDFNALYGCKNDEDLIAPYRMASMMMDIHFDGREEKQPKLHRGALGLYLYHNMMIKIRISNRSKPFDVSAPEYHPDVDLPPKEKQFWQDVNGLLNTIQSTPAELEQRFAQGIKEHLYYISSEGALLSIKRAKTNPKSTKYPELRQKASTLIDNSVQKIQRAFSFNVAQPRPGIVRAPGNKNSATWNLGNHKSIESSLNATSMSMMMVDEGIIGVRDFLNDHEKFMEDIRRHIYAPVMYRVPSKSEAEDILHCYAAGNYSMLDLLDVKPEYWTMASVITELPSPRTVFWHSMNDAILSLAKDKKLEGDAMDNVRIQLLNLQCSFTHATTPDEVAQYTEIANRYIGLKRRQNELGALSSDDLTSELKEVMRPFGYHGLKHLPATPDLALDAYDKIPWILSNKMRHLTSGAEALEAALPHLERKKRHDELWRRITDLEVEWEESIEQKLTTEERIALLKQHEGLLPKSEFPYVDWETGEFLSDNVPMGWNEAESPAYLQFMIALTKASKAWVAEKTAVGKKQEEKPRSLTIFASDQTVAERLHAENSKFASGAKSNLSTVVLPALWNEVTKLREMAAKNYALVPFSMAAFSDNAMRLIEYMAAPDPSKIGDANAIGKRFKNAREDNGRMRESIGDIIELAAVGDDESMALAKTIMTYPSLLIAASGDKQLIDQARGKMQSQKEVFESQAINAGLVREALIKIGVDQSAIDVFYPPPPLPETQYFTNNGMEFYTRSPRYRDISRALDSARGDTDMYLLGAIGENHNRFQCDLMLAPYGLKLTFADNDGKEQQHIVPLSVTNLDDALDIKIALQSYVLNQDEIEPLRRTIKSGKKSGVSKSDFIPPAAGSTDPQESTQPRIQANGGQLYCTLSARYKKKGDKQPILIPLGLADVDTPDNHVEREQRQEYVTHFLQEMNQRRVWRTKEELEQSLKQRFKEELGRSWLESATHVGVSGFESATPLKFPGEHSPQQSYISPASIWLEPGGSNPSYMLNYSIDVRHGKEGARETVRTRNMRLHTSESTLAMARARMALKQLEEAMEHVATQIPNCEWLFLPQAARKTYQSPLQTRSDVPGMTFNKLEETLDRVTNYEDDVWVSTKPVGNNQIRLSLIRAKRADAFDKDYNADLRRHAPRNTIEHMNAKTTGGKILPMAMTITILPEMENRANAFCQEVAESFSAAIGEHYNRISMDAIKVTPDEQDVYKGNPDYRENTARELFAHVVNEKNKEILDGAGVITEPLPERPKVVRGGRTAKASGAGENHDDSQQPYTGRG